jgi:hypothetical protein
MKDMYAKQQDKEDIPQQLAQSKSWAVYEVWVNENVSGLALTEQPDQSTHTRIIISPLYVGNDLLGAQNDSTLDKWLTKTLEENSDIYYLAIRKVSSDLNYEDAYEAYNILYKVTNDLNNTSWPLDKFDAETKMQNPTKVYFEGLQRYNFPIPYFGIVPQSLRGLEIKQGVAKIE